MKKIVTFLTAVVFLLSGVACKNGGEEGFQFTSYDLVLNGQSDYSVLVCADADENELYAASELVYFFREATGITLSVLRDNGNFNENSKCISIGRTPLFETQDEEVDFSALEWDGFTIFRKGSNLFIVGGEGRGDIYGVYEFLKLNLGIKVYAEDEMLIPVTENMKLLDINLTDKPDICIRQIENGFDPHRVQFFADPPSNPPDVIHGESRH